MNHTIVWSDGFLHLKTSGDADSNGMTEMLADILAHPKWKRGGAIFIDHSNLNSGPLTLEDICRLADRVSEVREKLGEARIAILVARDLEFGLVRVWEAYVSDQWDGVSRCFRSHSEAMAWLKSMDA